MYILFIQNTAGKENINAEMMLFVKTGTKPTQNTYFVLNCECIYIYIYIYTLFCF